MEKTNNAQWIYVSILSSCIVMIYVTCTVGEYDILPAKPEPDMATPPVAPAKPCTPGESRQFYPSDGGLSYSEKSACKPGTMICEKSDMGGTIWMELPHAIGKTTESCNGIDDDCNGTVDDITEPSCSMPGEGYCKVDKKPKCVSGKSECTPSVTPFPNTRYYPYPYQDSVGNMEWNRDCKNMTEAMFCLQSKLVPGSWYFESPDPSTCSTTINTLLGLGPSAFLNPTSPVCTTCTSINRSFYQIGVSPSPITNLSGTTIANAIDCGKSIPIVKCTWDTVAAKCTTSGADSIVVACK